MLYLFQNENCCPGTGRRAMDGIGRQSLPVRFGISLMGTPVDVEQLGSAIVGDGAKQISVEQLATVAAGDGAHRISVEQASALIIGNRHLRNSTIL